MGASFGRISRAVFSSVLANGAKAYRSPGVDITIARNQGNKPLLSVIVPKVAYNKATARNYIKRKVRAVFNSKIKYFPKDVAILVFLKSKVKELSTDDISEVCDQIYKKLV